MTDRNDRHRPNRKPSNRPYSIVGADRLSACIWKHGDERGGFRYQFNVYRMLAETGRVSQLFGPEDVFCLARLAHVLAITLLDDGCIDSNLRARLKEFIIRFDVKLMNQKDSEQKLEVVPILPDTIAAIQQVTVHHWHALKEADDGDADIGHLTSNLERVDEWLRFLGCDPNDSTVRTDSISH